MISNVLDVVDRVDKIISEGVESGMWPSEADCETLLAEIDALDIDAADVGMDFARRAVNQLRILTVLASEGYDFSVNQSMSFMWLGEAVRSQL
jgi:hypothetical protein